MLHGHGDDLYRYPNITANFSSNVYAHFDHEGLFDHLANRLDDVVNYPEPTPSSLERALAAYDGLASDQLMVTNGATEAIYLIAQTFRRSRSAILVPTFAEYADACRLHEHEVAHIYALSELQPRTQLLWLCCPNNPTGTVTPRDQLMRCIEDHPSTLFVVDASYAPYTDQPLLTATEAVSLPNVILLHSMTKTYAIPGLRLGYTTAHSALTDQLSRQRMPWAVNQVAIEAGGYLLRHADEYTLDVRALLGEARRVADRLNALGVVEVWPSDTHILLCHLRMGKAPALKDYLANVHGILIRDASNFAGLDDTFFRIAVQTPPDNDRLVDAIAAWLSE